MTRSNFNLQNICFEE